MLVKILLALVLLVNVGCMVVKRESSYNPNGWYEGNLINGLKNGKGTFYSRYLSYEGQWSNDMRNGEGFFYWYCPNDKIKGYYVDNKPTGTFEFITSDGKFFNIDSNEITSVFYWPHLNLYENDWNPEQRNGNIIQYFLTGDKFVGELKNGKRNGRGVFYSSNGNRYDCEWREDVIEGDCEINNQLYVGELKDGIQNGKGTLYYEDNSVYEGEWKNGEKNGQGVFTWSYGDKYDGDWENGKRNGKGIMYYYDGSKYEGDWKNDKREGFGEFNYPDENAYKGQWKNDMKNGKGLFVYSDGSKYEGFWINDLPTRKGIFNRSNGDTFIKE